MGWIGIPKIMVVWSQGLMMEKFLFSMLEKQLKLLVFYQVKELKMLSGLILTLHFWSLPKKMKKCVCNDKEIYRWDTRNNEGKPALTRKAHSGEVYSVDFNRKSPHLLLSGGEDSDVNLWDIRNLSKKVDHW